MGPMMTLDRSIFLFAGVMVLLSVALGPDAPRAEGDYLYIARPGGAPGDYSGGYVTIPAQGPAQHAAGAAAGAATGAGGVASGLACSLCPQPSFFLMKLNMAAL